MEFTRSDVKGLREELQKAIEKYAGENGLVIRFGNATYSDTEVNFKVSVVRQGVDNEKAKWESNCRLFGLAKEDYGKKIRLNGECYTVVGLKTSARKNIIVIQRDRDKSKFVISRETFIRCGGKDAFADFTFVETDPPTELLK